MTTANPKLLATAKEEAPKWSTEALLLLALKMLDEAKEEQRKHTDARQWLSNNLTLEVIRVRVDELIAARKV